ncbi:MAG: hypothetical protein JOS17DRAFT_450283 [Linnemannia elongata]|nr:MAG: hypothetical protein JOS17DRAFT_450283 [Linnemannia elongata]
MRRSRILNRTISAAWLTSLTVTNWIQQTSTPILPKTQLFYISLSPHDPQLLFEVPCRQTFSSARWALLQVCPHIFKDVPMHLFIKLCSLMKGRALLESVLGSIAREEFESLRNKLAAHEFPNFSSDSKLRLVINETQILSDKNPTMFPSSSIQGDPRPMSPFLHGFSNGWPSRWTQDHLLRVGVKV